MADVAVTPARAREPRRDAAPRAQRSRALRAAGWLALAVALALPVAVGGFRPQWWLLASAGLLALAAAASLAAMRARRDLLGPFRGAPPAAAAYAAFLVLLAAHVGVVGGVASDLDALYGLLRHLGLAALAYTLALSARRHAPARAQSAVILAALAAYAAYGLATVAAPEWLPYEKQAYWGYATGPFVNRNSFATFAGFGAVLGLASALADPRALPRHHRRGRRQTGLEAVAGAGLCAAAALLCLAAVFASGSRMGLAATLGGLATVAALAARRDLARGARRRALLLGGMLTVAGLAALVALLYGGAVAERLLGAADDASVRGALYRNVAAMIAERPLLGVGLDNFPEAFRAHHRLPVSPDRQWSLAHNTYLGLWAELGLVLGSLPILALALAARALWRRATAAAEAPTTHLAAAALGCLVLGGAHSFLDFSLEMPANACLLVAVVSLALAPPEEAAARASAGSA